MYGCYLGGYFKEFDKCKIFVGKYEDIVVRPDKLLEDICSFIEVDSHLRFINMRSAVLSASVARCHWLARLTQQAAVKLRDLGYENLIATMRQSKFISGVRYKSYSESQKPMLTNTDRSWLCEVYRRDIRILEKVLGQTFSNWVTVADVH